MKPLLDAYYAVQKRLWRLLRPRTRGVKVMLFNAGGELVLIRNGYGQTAHLLLPGGNVGLFETPEAAAAREVKEELGCEVCDLAPLSLHHSRAEGKRDTIHLFSGRIDALPRADGVEVMEARFVALDALPAETSPATRRRIEERLGLRVADGSW